MRILVTGGTGLAGRHIALTLAAAGASVVITGRSAGVPQGFPSTIKYLKATLDTDWSAAAQGAEAIVHCAFAHAPGRYRGGEGTDPDGFRRHNVDGTLALIEAARKAGVRRFVFLSSRAVYDGYPAGSTLREALPAYPANLYGSVKAEVEETLLAHQNVALRPTILRATGLYGLPQPGRQHKWAELFEDFLAGRPITPRAGTEVHAGDLAGAVRLTLTQDVTGVVNVSDIMLDRRDLLAEVAAMTGSRQPLPPKAARDEISVMDCARLSVLGWRPGGMTLLRRTVRELLQSSQAAPAPAASAKGTD